ncbi:MAG: replicative DNA helicase [Porphyromonadaceae bacterium]|nr:replicative DNA helicase [Porphyromonadaceae bacterium]
MILPNCENSEKSIIAGMMQSDSYYWNVVGEITPDHFYNGIFRKCFEKMVAEKRGDFQMLDVLCKTIEYDAAEFFNQSFSVTGKSEIDELTRQYKRRGIIITSQNAINSVLSDPDKNPTETMSEISTGLSRLCGDRTRDVSIVGNLVGEEFDRIEKMVNGGTSAFFKTGISDIDKMLIIEKTDYIPLGGRPSNCKSVLASQICRNLTKEGKVCLYFCFDSSRQTEVRRCLFAEANISMQDFSRNTPKRYLDSIKRSSELLSTLQLYFDNSRKPTTELIASQCRRVKSMAADLHFVVIDFMQNIKSPIQNIRERVSMISEELHDLPKDIGCPVMPLSQLSRYSNEDCNPPSINNLKETGDIEEDADKVLLVWYPEKYPSNRDKEEYKNLLNLYVEKNKNGTTGIIPLSVFADRFTVTNRITVGNEQVDQYGCFR